MMGRSQKEAGMIAVLTLHMRQSRLPRARRMLDKVDRGATLSENDIDFLTRVLRDVRVNQSLVNGHADFRKFMHELIDLYSEIVRKAVENEKKSTWPVSGIQAGAG